MPIGIAHAVCRLMTKIWKKHQKVTSFAAIWFWRGEAILIKSKHAAFAQDRSSKTGSFINQTANGYCKTFSLKKFQSNLKPQMKKSLVESYNRDVVNQTHRGDVNLEYKAALNGKMKNTSSIKSWAIKKLETIISTISIGDLIKFYKIK